MSFAVVAIGYNRVNSMRRLISSLIVADYQGDEVDLIISIDNSGKDDVEVLAKGIQWPYGKKIIKTYPERKGLRAHVLTCGDYVYDYDAIAVFEDDIWVAPSFYSYMKQAVDFYKEEDGIAGISLYSHLWSEQNSRPFVAEKRKYDNYFLQYAQSWGQVWMPKQWKAFREWYAEHDGEIEDDGKTPMHIIGWPKSSWLKYHIKYCIANNKYFVYPYTSYSTNFVEIGQHCKSSNSVYQVPMAYDEDREINFAKLGAEDVPYYDAFFERVMDANALGLEKGELLVNLYGQKVSAGERYMLTSKHLDYHVVKTYGLNLRPHEMNAIHDIAGDTIFLYDLARPCKNEVNNDYSMARWYYDSRVFDYRYIIRILARIIRDKLIKR